MAENNMLMKCPFCGRSVKWVKHLSARFVNIFGCVCECGAEGSWQSTEKKSMELWSRWVRDGE